MHSTLPNDKDPFKKMVITQDPTWLLNDCDECSTVGNLAKPFLNDEQLDLISLVLISNIQIFNIIGLVGNILSITVFTKLGFSEPSHISLLALAASELTCVVLSIWTNLCFIPDFRDSRLPFHPINISTLTGAGLWAFVVRTVAWITAFISFERCLCILAPLKVKRYITSKTTFTAMLLIAALTICPSFLIYIRWHFVWMFYPHLNATILDVIPIDNKYYILLTAIVRFICGVLQPLLAFAIVVLCTFFLIIQLRKVSSWRKSVTSGEHQWGQNSEKKPTPNAPGRTTISQKEERLVRLVVVIATVFIVCFTPTSLQLLFSSLFEGFFYFGFYRRIYFVVQLITFLGEAVSGAVNILIYYNMFSKYRFTLRRLIGLENQEQANKK
ncbi:chemosensory receptor a [Plakobranchus ocellatus]|uniref:Chemosensory receptor a n=1 Tax=Plakobranchus ocellatus TaxID=259542 RepID=A0AAV4C7A1_9GAST|nr:chemosensory receptor a [Plakobranchus ocellatus]